MKGEMDDFRGKIRAHWLFKNGGDFNILLSTYKFSLLASFRVTYSFKNLNQERG